LYNSLHIGMLASVHSSSHVKQFAVELFSVMLSTLYRSSQCWLQWSTIWSGFISKWPSADSTPCVWARDFVIISLTVWNTLHMSFFVHFFKTFTKIIKVCSFVNFCALPSSAFYSSSTHKFLSKYAYNFLHYILLTYTQRKNTNLIS